MSSRPANGLSSKVPSAVVLARRMQGAAYQPGDGEKFIEKAFADKVISRDEFSEAAKVEPDRLTVADGAVMQDFTRYAKQTLEAGAWHKTRWFERVGSLFSGRLLPDEYLSSSTSHPKLPDSSTYCQHVLEDLFEKSGAWAEANRIARAVGWPEHCAALDQADDPVFAEFVAFARQTPSDADLSAGIREHLLEKLSVFTHDEREARRAELEPAMNRCARDYLHQDWSMSSFASTFDRLVYGLDGSRRSIFEVRRLLKERVVEHRAERIQVLFDQQVWPKFLMVLQDVRVPPGKLPAAKALQAQVREKMLGLLIRDTKQVPMQKLDAERVMHWVITSSVISQYAADVSAL